MQGCRKEIGGSTCWGWRVRSKQSRPLDTAVDRWSSWLTHVSSARRQGPADINPRLSAQDANTDEQQAGSSHLCRP